MYWPRNISMICIKGKRKVAQQCVLVEEDDEHQNIGKKQKARKITPGKNGGYKTQETLLYTLYTFILFEYFTNGIKLCPFR